MYSKSGLRASKSSSRIRKPQNAPRSPEMSTPDRIQTQATELARRWAEEERWNGISRTYEPEDVVRLRGSVVPESTLARLGAERLWRLLTTESYIPALGALSGG